MVYTGARGIIEADPVTSFHPIFIILIGLAHTSLLSGLLILDDWFYFFSWTPIASLGQFILIAGVILEMKNMKTSALQGAAWFVMSVGLGMLIFKVWGIIFSIQNRTTIFLATYSGLCGFVIIIHLIFSGVFKHQKTYKLN